MHVGIAAYSLKKSCCKQSSR